MKLWLLCQADVFDIVEWGVCREPATYRFVLDLEDGMKIVLCNEHTAMLRAEWPACITEITSLRPLEFDLAVPPQ